MQKSFWFQLFRGGHPALSHVRFQLFTLFFLGLAGCVSSPPPNLSGLLPEGYYQFDCPIVYEKGMAKLVHSRNGVRIQLLEEYTGSFSLQISSDQSLKIVDDEMDYPGLKRTFKGDGRLIRPGVAEGEAVMWLKSVGPISRNHREGPWTLRTATPEEIKRFELKQKTLQERRQRAAEAADAS